MAANGPSKKQESEFRVELFTHNGTRIGYHRTIGAGTPAVLFKGSELYVHSGTEGIMRTLAPGERLLAALIAERSSK